MAAAEGSAAGNYFVEAGAPGHLSDSSLEEVENVPRECAEREALLGCDSSLEEVEIVAPKFAEGVLLASDLSLEEVGRKVPGQLLVAQRLRSDFAVGNSLLESKEQTLAMVMVHILQESAGCSIVAEGELP